MIRIVEAAAVFALALAGVSQASAQSRARCPPGQIWRVSKSVCQPKSENMRFFGGAKNTKSKSEHVAAPAPKSAPVAAPSALVVARPEPPSNASGVDHDPVGTIRPREPVAGVVPADQDAAVAPTPPRRPEDVDVATAAPDAPAEEPRDVVRSARDLPPLVTAGLYGDEQRVFQLVKAASPTAQSIGHSVSPGEILADSVPLRPLPAAAAQELAMFRDLKLRYVVADGAVALVLPASRMVLRVIAEDHEETPKGARD